MQGGAHLLNIRKISLVARCASNIEVLQSRSYNLRDVRIVQLCLLKEFYKGKHLSALNSTQWAKYMYEKSLLLEGPESSVLRIENKDRQTNGVILSANDACGTGFSLCNIYTFF